MAGVRFASWGVRLSRLVDLDMAAYALWQVRDDVGAYVPAALRGARDQVYGAGPEINVLISPIHASVNLRYEHDFAVQSRPEAQIAVCSLSWAAWRPSRSRLR